MINCRKCKGKGWPHKVQELQKRRDQGEQVMIPTGLTTTYKTENVPRSENPRYIIRYHICHNCGTRFKSIQSFHQYVNEQNEFNLEVEDD